MVPQRLFAAEKELIRDTVRRCVETGLRPLHAAWEAADMVPRDAWFKAGAVGLLVVDAKVSMIQDLGTMFTVAPKLMPSSELTQTAR
jgi:hypothetical protein